MAREEFQCQINISEGKPIYQRPYQVPISKLTRMNNEIHRMLNMGIIEKSTSPWSSPIVAIEKKMKNLMPDQECPSNIEEILIKFEGAKFMSSLDLTAGYWQCQLKEECRAITVFLYRGRNYQYKVLPFGLINSVAEF